MSTLVTFFSAEGTTQKVAEEFAQKINADIFEIVPASVEAKLLHSADEIVNW